MKKSLVQIVETPTRVLFEIQGKEDGITFPLGSVELAVGPEIAALALVRVAHDADDSTVKLEVRPS